MTLQDDVEAMLLAARAAGGTGRVHQHWHSHVRPIGTPLATLDAPRGKRWVLAKELCQVPAKDVHHYVVPDLGDADGVAKGRRVVQAGLVDCPADCYHCTA